MRLVLGTAGAVIGFYAGGPTGASIGWSIGSAIGGIVDPQVTKQQGPRLSDLRVQLSSWGAPIPRDYGMMRHAGNVVWSSGLRETSHTESQGGKGGPSVETTTYTYSADFAIALCEGTIENVRRIWADGRLIYNSGTDANADTLAAYPLPMTLYLGDETQEPDPIIESALGVGNVSAYRGLAYGVFENFQLADYGNRIPNFEFEICVESTSAYSWYETNDLSMEYAPISYYGNLMGATYSDTDGIHIYQVLSNDVNVIEWIKPWDGEPYKLRVINYPGIIASIGGTPGNDQITRGRCDSPGFFISSTSAPKWVSADGSAITYTLPSTVRRTQSHMKKGDTFACYDEYGKTFIAVQGSTALQQVSGPSGYSLPTYGEVRCLQITENYLIVGHVIASGGYVLALVRYSLVDGSRVDQLMLPPGIFGDMSDAYALDDDTIITSYSSGALYQLDIPTGDVTSYGRDLNGAGATFVDASPTYNWQYFEPNDAVYSVVLTYRGFAKVAVWKSGVTSTDAILSDIVTSLCERSGLTSGDLETTDLTDSVTGYTITRQESARASIDQLQKAYFFDATEADNKVAFIKRGGSVVVNIPSDDIGAMESGSSQTDDALGLKRVQELDLPSSVVITYANQAADYQVATERASRLVTKSDINVTVNLAIALSVDKAAKIADVLLFDAYAGRTSASWATTKKYAKYLPTDVVTVENDNGIYRLRITKKQEAGAIITWEGVTDDATIYTSVAEGGTYGTTQTQVESPGITRNEILDIPILRDEDNDPGLYFALGGYKPAWKGAALYRSPDDNDYSQVGSVTRGATMGWCDATLATWDGGNFFDEKNTLTVTLDSGSLSSVTYDLALAGSNAALVGSEIIFFQTATLVGTNQYTLSGLWRGRFGTEQYISTHSYNERFVFFSTSGMLRINEGASIIGIDRYYKAVSFGRSLLSTPSQEYANTAVGLMPYAPCLFSGGKQVNDDFIIGWTRRTRIDGSWRNLVDVPLGEESQSYEVDIMSGTTIKRTLTSASATVTYTSAMQTTDFGSPQSTITVNVYQMSATVGRGFPGNHVY
jgi:hypothetical protein